MAWSIISGPHSEQLAIAHEQQEHKWHDACPLCCRLWV